MKSDKRRYSNLVFVFMMILTLCCGCSIDISDGGDANQTQEVQVQNQQEEEGVVVEEENDGNQKDDSESEQEEQVAHATDHSFRNDKLLEEHFDKHGKEMGFSDAEQYEEAADMVIHNPDALHKLEQEDGDDVYYVESTNEFVIVSPDGYIRTYFYPNSGKKYYDRQ